ncbi:MAG: DUF302 domain-containing protein [Candidatus Roizmanbacteria bacterium]|nr:DUF302 domain-containing protein [Candidatus Roizmanbacteria bacterium]
MNYSIRKQINYPFADAVAKVKDELSKEGFGVLTEIDVKKTLKNKLHVEWGNYVILGACNPPFAFQALQTEKEIGLFLPCNVIVYEDGGTVYASTIRPTVAMNMVENPALTDIAEKVEEKLLEVINNL